MSSIWANRLRRAIRRRPTELFYHAKLEFKALKDRFRTSPISNSPEETLPRIFGVKNITEFKQQAPLSNIIYEGELELEKYTRFMLIGYK